MATLAKNQKGEIYSLYIYIYVCIIFSQVKSTSRVSIRLGTGALILPSRQPSEQARKQEKESEMEILKTNGSVAEAE